MVPRAFVLTLASGHFDGVSLGRFNEPEAASPGDIGGSVIGSSSLALVGW